MSIEQDLSRIADALEQIAGVNTQVATLARAAYQGTQELTRDPRVSADLYVKMFQEEAPAPEAPPAPEFKKPAPGPGRPRKKAVEPLPEEPAVEPKAAEPEPPELPAVTELEVKQALVDAIKAGKKDQVYKILEVFGVKSGGDLKPDQYFDALMAFKEALSA